MKAGVANQSAVNSGTGLDTPVRFVKGVGEARSKQLARLDIHVVGDLLYHLPSRYEDRSAFKSIGDLIPNEAVGFEGVVVTCGWVRPRFGKSFYEAVLEDATGPRVPSVVRGDVFKRCAQARIAVAVIRQAESCARAAGGHAP